MREHTGTDDILRKCLPHLRPAFLRYLNDRIGRLKREDSGNGQTTIIWSGGVDQRVQWLTDDRPPKD